MLPSEIPQFPIDPACERVSYCSGNFSSFRIPSSGQVSVPKSFVSTFVFIFCPTSFWRDWFASLGIWGPLPVFRSCFVEDTPNVDIPLMYLWGRKWPPWFLKKLEIELLYDPAIPLLGIHTEETRSERDTCTPMFIAALFIIARTWKQPRCPSADEWLRKLWYIYTMKYYSAIKKNSFESVLMRWMKLEPIIQSEVSQKDKHQYSILTHIYGI